MLRWIHLVIENLMGEESGGCVCQRFVCTGGADLGVLDEGATGRKKTSSEWRNRAGRRAWPNEPTLPPPWLPFPPHSFDTHKDGTGGTYAKMISYAFLSSSIPSFAQSAVLNVTLAGNCRTSTPTCVDLSIPGEAVTVSWLTSSSCGGCGR